MHGHATPIVQLKSDRRYRGAFPGDDGRLPTRGIAPWPPAGAPAA